MNKSSHTKKNLVFGIGVIGAYLTHALAEAGSEVTMPESSKIGTFWLFF